jgi:hypothetical protein
VEQRDLAEALARAERSDETAIAEHLGLAALDRVEAITVVALMEDRFAAREAGAFDVNCHVVDRRHRQPAEGGHCPEHFDLPLRRRLEINSFGPVPHWLQPGGAPLNVAS